MWSGLTLHVSILTAEQGKGKGKGKKNARDEDEVAGVGDP